MITVRPNITVPAAGEYELVRIAARVIFIEESPVNTPEGAPTLHFERGSDGIPLYSRSSIHAKQRPVEFWIRGTTESAGESLRLFIADDPCADFENMFEFNDCAEAETPLVEPTGTPTHILAVSSSGNAISVYTNTGALVRNIVTGRNNIGSIYVEYIPNWIYFGSRNASDEVILSRINFDGTGETVLANFGVLGATQDVHVTKDLALGKFFIACSSRILECDFDGSNTRTVNTVSVQWQGLAAGGDGVHVFACGSGDLVKYVVSTGTEVDHDNGGNGKIVSDPVTSRIFHHRGTADAVDVSDYDPVDDNSNRSTFIETDVSAGTVTGIYIYLRWLYFSLTDSIVQRVHLDDPDVEAEEIATGLSVPSFIAPWWEP